MRLVVISGRSGSGKSSALHVLEDQGFYCIDNLPISMLPALVAQTGSEEKLSRVAVSIDARNLRHAFDHIDEILHQLPNDEYQLDVVYLDASEEVLMQRFSSTRRKHPLTSDTLSLAEAIDQEKDLLEPIANLADLTLDTTSMSVHELRSLIKMRVAGKTSNDIAILFESFGFKHGIPIDADYVFDVRNLPNPYWDPGLRSYNGLQQPVIDFLGHEPQVAQMQEDIAHFMQRWLPAFIEANRSYMTVAIGCTGGQHRSVYLAERLKEEFASRYANVQIRHRELSSQELS
ncbi:MAG: RNase adapter RapZ [Oceanospirillaceae bacterium]|nr:RNase adapter RapZ [Oceanospirillaceae bacterium]MBT13150.1 RNase adapter RapZ [Oceanospirillaceae bacterium]|tara:strand:+ start:74028 stop:74894 length:867 start_codon:yes stop_codon:yes gene_type:complete